MCGRFSVTFDPGSLADELGLDEPPPHLPPRWNVAPTQPVAAVANVHPRRLDLFRWGLIPGWAKDEKVGHRMINARAETLSSRGAFKKLLEKQRCLIPADGFFEWQKEPGSKRKQAMLIRRKNGQPFAFAGLWDLWRPRGSHDEIKSVTIVTTAPNALVAPIHDRMPVILTPDKFEAWLSDELTAEQAAKLLTPIAADELEVVPVSSRVNDPNNDDAACIAPPNADELEAAAQATAATAAKAAVTRAAKTGMTPKSKAVKKPKPPSPQLSLFGDAKPQRR